VVLVLVVILGTGVGMLWALQRQLIYFPDASPVSPAADVIPGSRDVTLHTADGLELGAWFLPAAGGEDTGMAVMFAPGNGGNRAGRATFAEALSRRGFAVLLMDYRGYGGNPGTPSQAGLTADAKAAVQALVALRAVRTFCLPAVLPRADHPQQLALRETLWVQVTTVGEIVSERPGGRHQAGWR